MTMTVDAGDAAGPAAGPAAASARPAARPGDLQIAGLVPMSSVDWPGKLVATVFLQGCPWRCVYCHNTALLDPRLPGLVDWADVESLLARRRGLLDAVVFSGGEATRQEALLPAAARVRELGFAVGLHTAGAYPTRLARLLPHLDWVGLDLKALPGSYGAVVATPGARPGEAAWASLDLVLAEAARRPGFGYEVRTTVCPSLGDDDGDDGVGDAPVPGADLGARLTVADALAVARRCRELGVTTFALQEARTRGTDPAFAAPAEAAVAAAVAAAGGEAWRARFARLTADVAALDFPVLDVRPA